MEVFQWDAISGNGVINGVINEGAPLGFLNSAKVTTQNI